jgi:hypothetical protein
MFRRGFDESLGTLGVAEVAAGGAGMKRLTSIFDRGKRTAAERA